MRDVSLFHTRKKREALKVLINTLCSSCASKRLETFKDDKCAGFWKYRSRAVTPQGLCSSSDWIMFGQILSPCRTMAQLLSVPRHMRADACYTRCGCLVTQWPMSDVSTKSWLFCNVPEWRENSFWSRMVNLFVLWSMKIAIFVWGCITVSNAFIPPWLMNLSLQFCSPFLTEGVLSSGLPFQTWMLSGFLWSLRHEDNSYFHDTNILRLSRTKWESQA